MTPNADPWRTLGLAPGASADEVRRAYRRLAKANHPDAAGEKALPRFLAIQAAYEQLLGPSVARRPGSRPAGTRAAPKEPWRAEPDRARASGRADGRRPGARPGAGPGRRGSGAPADETPPKPGGSGGRTPPGGPSGDGAARSRRASGGRRAPNKAGPYSTSYDPADEEPFEPGWSGASWYGTSSGTYWTINPKEYADPRKHGPEYQRRARRPAGGWILDEDDPAQDPAPEPEPDDDGRPPAGPSPTDTTPDSPSAGSSPASARPARPRHARATAARAEARPAEAGPGGPRPGWVPTSGHGQEGSDASPDAGLPRLRPPRSLTGRVAAAIIAWPALGAVLASAIQESSGCGRFAASCPELSSPGTWVLHAAIIVLLFALPRLAVWLATGAIAAFVAGLATTVVLSAAGGTNMLTVSAPILAIALVAGYAVGVSYAVVLDGLDGRRRRVG